MIAHYKILQFIMTFISLIKRLIQTNWILSM